MALVDEALKKKKKKDHLESVEFNSHPEYDELGLRVRDTTDYVVARILKLNTDLYTDQEKKLIYQGRGLVQQTPASLYRLSQSRRPIPPHYQQIVWVRLLSLLPVMDEHIIEVTPDLYWDKNKGELYEHTRGEI